MPTYKTVKATVRNCCKALRESGRTFEDIYNIVFDRTGVLAETSDSTGIRTFTYEDTRTYIDKLALAIASRAGEDRYVALYCDNRVEWIYLFWAILKSGNKPYLVNLLQPDEFTASVLETLGIELVIYYEKVGKFSQKCVSFHELMEAAETEEMRALPFGNEIALTTSGTTLKQKICLYSGEEISWQALNSEQAIEWHSNIKTCCHGKLKMLASLPLFHIFGLEAVYLWFCFFGAIFVFPQSMAPDVLLKTIRDHEVTHIFSVPVLWHSVEKSVRREIAQQDEATRRKFEQAARLSLKLQNISPKLGTFVASRLFKGVRAKLFGDSVRFCISGGSHIKDSALELINSLGYLLVNGYGMTEIGIAAADFSHKPRKRLENCIGRNFSSLEFFVDGGKLLVKGASVCKRMLIDGEPVYNTDWFDTGDIVEDFADGRYRILGRASDVVIGENGENLNPDLAEKSFDLPDAKAMTILGDENNENLILIVQIPQDLSAEAAQRLNRDIELGMSRLNAAYRLKSVFYTADPIMGEKDIKVSRAKVKRWVSDGRIRLTSAVGQVDGETRVTEDSETKKILRAMFASVLNVPESDITDNGHFLNDLGGSSLDYFTLISEVNERFGITMDFESENSGYSLNDFEKNVEELTKV